MDFSSITEPTKEILPRIPQAVLILIIGFFAINATKYFAQKILKISRINEAISNILISIGVVFLWIVFAVFILKSLGFTGLAIAISGSIVVIGLAVATGAKNLTADILAGIFLSWDKDFNIGDKIKTTKVEGKIIDIDIRKTRLIDKKGILHVVPNSVLEKAEWSVIKKSKIKDQKKTE